MILSSMNFRNLVITCFFLFSSASFSASRNSVDIGRFSFVVSEALSTDTALVIGALPLRDCKGTFRNKVSRTRRNSERRLTREFLLLGPNLKTFSDFGQFSWQETLDGTAPTKNTGSLPICTPDSELLLLPEGNPLGALYNDD